MPVVGASAAVAQAAAKSSKKKKSKKSKFQTVRTLLGDENYSAFTKIILKKRRQEALDDQSDDEIIVGDIKGEESDDSDNESDNGTEESPWQLPHQKFMKDSYLLNSVQYGVAGLIFANFIVSAAEAQVLATE